LVAIPTPVQKWSKKVFAEYQQKLTLPSVKAKSHLERALTSCVSKIPEGAIVRVIGWKSVKQEFSHDLLKQVLKNNPH
jgi:hypothetical protein